VCLLCIITTLLRYIYIYIYIMKEGREEGRKEGMCARADFLGCRHRVCVLCVLCVCALSRHCVFFSLAAVVVMAFAGLACVTLGPLRVVHALLPRVNVCVCVCTCSVPLARC
jgi:hypothetical protein